MTELLLASTDVSAAAAAVRLLLLLIHCLQLLQHSCYSYIDKWRPTDGGRCSLAEMNQGQ